jgi:hypothetical protein
LETSQTPLTTRQSEVPTNNQELDSVKSELIEAHKKLSAKTADHELIKSKLEEANKLTKDLER